jgi:hypothetical protein
MARQPPIETVEELLGVVFSVVSAPTLYNEKIEKVENRQLSRVVSWQLAVGI